MKVKELIEILKSQDQDKDVMFSFPSHDYWRTVLAAEVDSVEVQEVRWSDYHTEHRLLDEDSDERDGAREVVLLSD